MRFTFQSALYALLGIAFSGCTIFFEKPGTALAEFDATGQTALQWAARGGHQLGPHYCSGEDTNRAAVVEALIELGADPNAIDRRGSIPGGSSGWTPLHIAMHHEQVATADRLLERGANPNIRSRQGTSVMAMAADEGAPRELVTKLMAKGFDPRRAIVPPRH